MVIGPLAQYPKLPSMPCFTRVQTHWSDPSFSSMPLFDLVLYIGELTPIGPLAQYPKLTSMPCFTMVLDTLERPPHFSSMPCFDLVLDIGELTIVGLLAQYPKLPSMPCFKMVLDTLEISPYFSSLPCFGLVLDIGELSPSFSLIRSFSLIFLMSNILNNTTKTLTSYLCLHPLSLVFVYPFSRPYYFPVFSLLILLAHAAISLHGFLPTRLFQPVFFHTTSLAG